MEDISYLHTSQQLKQEIEEKKKELEDDRYKQIIDELKKNSKQYITRKDIVSSSDYIQKLKDDLERQKNEIIKKLGNHSTLEGKETLDFFAGYLACIEDVFKRFEGELKRGEQAEIIEKLDKQFDKKE